jgi:transcriptional regulator with GAF, ATPase, and Fis domain
VKGSYTGADVSRDGKFLRANGGTLFLDEIGDMSLKAQPKVLRAIQEGEIEKVGGTDPIRVDVRVIAATNKNLPEETSAGRFREDLYFRLNVIPIHVPPLRDRREDVPKLATHFLERFRLENNRPPLSLTNEASDALAKLVWPGNVRELANVIERLAIMAPGPEIGAGELASLGILEGIGSVAAGSRGAGGGGKGTGPAGVGVTGAGFGSSGSAGPETIPALSPQRLQELGGLVEARRLFEAACIREGLRVSEGNVSEAARLLGIDRTNLHKKIQAYGIETEKGPG